MQLPACTSWLRNGNPPRTQSVCTVSARHDGSNARQQDDSHRSKPRQLEHAQEWQQLSRLQLVRSSSSSIHEARAAAAARRSHQRTAECAGVLWGGGMCVGKARQGCSRSRPSPLLMDVHSSCSDTAGVVHCRSTTGRPCLCARVLGSRIWTGTGFCEQERLQGWHGGTDCVTL